jgi:hypothetical protein
MNVSSVTNHFPTANKGFITTLGSSVTAGAATVSLTSVSNLVNGAVFVGIVEPGTAKEQEFTGVIDTAGVQITGVVWTDGTNVDHAAGSTVVDYVSATGQNMMTKGITAHANQDGSLVPSAVRTALGLGNTSNDGWGVVSQNVTAVTSNGNRSYDLTFDATVASVLSPGMRLQVTKTVTGNSYMGGAFNGSSHYFTKTSPSGTLGTVANNFTIEAFVQPTSYATGVICGRADAPSNNAFELRMQSDGRVCAVVFNAGAANYREINTYQSLSLNKKTHVAASWASGTVVIYFDGVSVPVAAAVTGGTAPTTAATGGDFSIGRKGAFAGNYFPGYISNVAVFDAVLSAATIKNHSTIKLLGSETNCIGAWSLDNTANDQNAAGNNLTATGGVGFTAMSPHGQLGNSVDATKAMALVMAVGTTTITVQCPEGCTIPTSGGISAVSYSTQANPFNWSSKGILARTCRVLPQSTTSSTSFTALADGGDPAVTVYCPTGEALVTVSAFMINSGADGSALTGYAVSGATTIGANDSRCAFSRLTTATAFQRFSYTTLVTDLNVGYNTFTMKHRVPSGTGSFDNREISVIPQGL